MNQKQPCVYILASKKNGTLYTGVTADIVCRVYEHKQNTIAGFSRRYAVHQLVYFELHENMIATIQREKQIKAWKRQWKIKLIEKENPHWRDLYSEIVH